MAEMPYAATLVERRKRVLRERLDAFDLSDTQFVSHYYRLTKAATAWLCSELRPALQRKRNAVNTVIVTAEQLLLCAPLFYAAAGFQSMSK